MATNQPIVAYMEMSLPVFSFLSFTTNSTNFFVFWLVGGLVCFALFCFGCTGSSLQCTGSLLLCTGSLAAATKGVALSLLKADFSLRWLLFLWSMGSRPCELQ